MAHGGTDKFWRRLMPSQGVRLPTTKKVEFRDADLYIQSAAASTLDIFNARTTTKTINISGAPVLQGGNTTASGTRHIAFRAADQYIYSSAASTLDIMNDGTSTQAVNIKGTLTLKGGNTTASGTRAIQFRAADLYVQSSAASVLNVVNARTSGSIRVGGTANYAQFKEDGELTFTGNAMVKRQDWLPALTWDASDGNACPSKALGINAPSIFIAGSATTEVVPVYNIWRVPVDMTTACNMVAWVDVSTRIRTGSGQLAVKWDFIAIGEATGTAGSGTVTAKYTGASKLESASLTIPEAPVSGDLAVLTVQYNGVGSAGSRFDFYGMRLQYVADKLGTAL